MNSFAVITIKRFDAAKQRLAGSIEEGLRRRLVEAMFGDVLEAVVAARLLGGIVVVTGESRAQKMALATGAEVLADPENGGHSAASLLGIERAIELGADRVVLLPGDCPLLDPHELDRLLTGMPSPWVAVVPDRHGTGTNAVVIAPPRAIDPSFGEGSCERHLELARAAGVPTSREPVPTLALDLDTPADIIALTREIESRRADRQHRRPAALRTAEVLGI